MKNHIFFALSFLFVNTLYSQVLYTENFDNHSVGNLGTDYTGIIPGQWGWITKAVAGSTQSNSVFTIVNESSRGNVLDVTAVSTSEGLYVFKPNLSQVIDSRTTGNDVIKFEMDYFTGPISTIPYQSAEIWILKKNAVMDYLITPEFLSRLSFNKTNGVISAQTIGNISMFGGGSGISYSLPFNTWVKLIIYFDYQNKTAYLDIPILKKAFYSDFLKNTNSVNIMQDYKPDKLVFTLFMTEDMDKPPGVTRNRYDNIQITALNAVPPAVISLSTNEQLSSKFNIYPNPANNVVNITNSENMTVKQIEIYDLAGKLINTHFNNETDIQLNVETLTSGTYLLHLHTNEGTAAKKLIKK